MKRESVKADVVSVAPRRVKVAVACGILICGGMLAPANAQQAQGPEAREDGLEAKLDTESARNGVAFSDLAARCAPSVHPHTLAAVVRTESRANPLAIGINTKGVRLPRQPATRAEAVATAKWLMARGYNFDAGLAQINSANFDWLGLGVEDLFDPCLNLRASATVLTDCYQRAAKGQGAGQAALRAALSCYNTGNFQRGMTNGYVARVAAQAGVIVPSLRPESVVSGTIIEQSDETPPPPKAIDPNAREDAFTRQGADAFAPKPLKAQGSRATAVTDDGSGPVMLKASMASKNGTESFAPN